MIIETFSSEQTAETSTQVEEHSIPAEEPLTPPVALGDEQEITTPPPDESNSGEAANAVSDAESAASLKELLLGTKPKVLSSVETMIGLPWVVGVTATVEAWPDMKPASRKNFLAALAGQQTEQARRFRLSLGRGMLPLDAVAALTLISSVCSEMIESGSGVPSQKDRQIFANVLIGKGKPWLLHLPLSELEDEKVGSIIHCAIVTCFPGQCPPLTQCSVLRWIGAADKLSAVPEELLQSAAKAVKRWHPKLQAELKSGVPVMPPILEEALIRQAPPESRAENVPRQEPPPRPVQERRVLPPYPQPPARVVQTGFDLVSSLRQIEAHVNSLRSDLNHARTELRRQADTPSPARGRGRDRRRSSDEPPAAEAGDVEELRRHNQQLVETITELRSQLEEIAADHEDLAASMQAHDDAPLANEKEQYRLMLGIKLREHYSQFEAMEKEPPDEVFREHYRMLIREVFDTLEKQGVTFKS